eukprot:gene7374-7584_t
MPEGLQHPAIEPTIKPTLDLMAAVLGGLQGWYDEGTKLIPTAITIPDTEPFVQQIDNDLPDRLANTILRVGECLVRQWYKHKGALTRQFMQALCGQDSFLQLALVMVGYYAQELHIQEKGRSPLPAPAPLTPCNSKSTSSATAARSSKASGDVNCNNKTAGGKKQLLRVPAHHQQLWQALGCPMIAKTCADRASGHGTATACWIAASALDMLASSLWAIPRADSDSTNFTSLVLQVLSPLQLTMLEWLQLDPLGIQCCGVFQAWSSLAALLGTNSFRSLKQQDLCTGLRLLLHHAGPAVMYALRRGLDGQKLGKQAAASVPVTASLEEMILGLLHTCVHLTLFHAGLPPGCQELEQMCREQPLAAAVTVEAALRGSSNLDRNLGVKQNISEKLHCLALVLLEVSDTAAVVANRRQLLSLLVTCNKTIISMVHSPATDAGLALAQSGTAPQPSNRNSTPAIAGSNASSSAVRLPSQGVPAGIGDRGKTAASNAGIVSTGGSGGSVTAMNDESERCELRFMIDACLASLKWMDQQLAGVQLTHTAAASTHKPAAADATPRTAARTTGRQQELKLVPLEVVLRLRVQLAQLTSAWSTECCAQGAAAAAASGDTCSKDTSKPNRAGDAEQPQLDVSPQLSAKLQSFASKVVGAIPVDFICNNPYCTNLSKGSMSAMVMVKGTVCSGCHIAR